jgi:hypothetical protein
MQLTLSFFSHQQQARYKRQAVDVTTFEVAYNVCVMAFEQSKAFMTCQQYVTDLSNSTIDNCIADVRVST